MINKMGVDYPYDQALSDLTIFFRRKIKNREALDELLATIDSCRQRKTVSIKAIDQLYLSYQKKYDDYTPLSDSEKEMWNNPFFIWG